MPGHRTVTLSYYLAICGVVVSSTILVRAASLSQGGSFKTKPALSHWSVGASSGHSAAAATAAPSPAQAERPSFNSPPSYSVAGSSVGLGGMYSMVHADFNGDGIPDVASVGFYSAPPTNGT